MKLHERLEELASRQEADAAAIRRALAILQREESVTAKAAIRGKLAKAIGLRNGNGNGNGHAPASAVGIGRGRRPKDTTIWEKTRDFLQAQDGHRAQLIDIYTKLGLKDTSVVSGMRTHGTVFKSFGDGVWGLKGNGDGPKQKPRSKAYRAAMSKRMKARWRKARKEGLIGKDGKLLAVPA